MTVIFSPWLNSIEAPWWEPPAATPLTESPSAIQPEQNDNVLVKSKRVRHFFIDPTVLYHNWTVRLYAQHQHIHLCLHLLNIHLLKNLPIQSLHQSPTLSVYFFDSFKGSVIIISLKHGLKHGVLSIVWLDRSFYFLCRSSLEPKAKRMMFCFFWNRTFLKYFLSI